MSSPCPVVLSQSAPAPHQSTQSWPVLGLVQGNRQRNACLEILVTRRLQTLLGHVASSLNSRVKPQFLLRCNSTPIL